ncbi:TonB-dependent receptor [Mucilaginibacter sp. S1162]|uniref:TonB-dependent receptor n=1 Tax=Mucilaginibacter humi TaxID=2732510 RepID=A0ABX1W5A1_9SPHI|nr:TonB-dependent receptor [Mucilaginibacter humi]
MVVCYLQQQFRVNSGTDIYTGRGLKPSIVDQYEAGIKNEFLDGKLSANFSIYRIINNDLAVTAPFLADGATPNSDATKKQFNGQTTSDGLEVDVNGYLSPNLYFIVGYAYNFMRYTKTSGLKGSSIEGEQIVINPRNTANASIFYTFSANTLRGFKVGASAFYTGSRRAVTIIQLAKHRLLAVYCLLVVLLRLILPRGIPTKRCPYWQGLIT